MSKKQLYVVRFTAEEVVWAESEREAISVVCAATSRDNFDFDVDVDPWTGVFPSNWNEKCLVYTAEGYDITLGACLQEVSARPEVIARECELAGQQRLSV